jgi:hypothetical protein
MVQKIYTLYTTEDNPFEQMCQILLSQIDRESNVLKIVFFGPPQNNTEYLNQLQMIKQCTKEHFAEQCCIFGKCSPGLW